MSHGYFCVAILGYEQRRKRKHTEIVSEMSQVMQREKTTGKSETMQREEIGKEGLTQKEVQTENKMGTMPVDRLLLSMSLPMMISMLVQALYNIVDSIFVSQINEYALRAVSLAFPVQSLMIAVAVGTAVGINAFLSRTLGEKEFEKANLIAGNGIFIAMVSYAAFALIGIFVSRPFFCQSDCNSGGAGVWDGVSDDLLRGKCGYFYAGYL